MISFNQSGAKPNQASYHTGFISVHSLSMPKLTSSPTSRSTCCISLNMGTVMCSSWSARQRGHVLSACRYCSTYGMQPMTLSHLLQAAAGKVDKKFATYFARGSGSTVLFSPSFAPFSLVMSLRIFFSSEMTLSATSDLLVWSAVNFLCQPTNRQFRKE